LKPNMDMPTFKLQTGLSIDEIADFEPNILIKSGYNY